MTIPGTRYPRQSLLFSLATLLLLVPGVLLASVPATTKASAKPIQEWIYLTVQSPTWNRGQTYIAVMTRTGQVPYREGLDLATVAYDYAGAIFTYSSIQKQLVFNFLKTFFGLDTITPAQIGALFGSNCTVAYAHLYNLGPRAVHTVKDIIKGLADGSVKQDSSVKIRIKD